MGLILSLDYETQSALDLTKIGAYRYAQSAKIMCAGYAIYEENTFKPEMVKPWRAWKGEPMPGDLLAALSDESVRKFAWNAQFERLITLHAAGLAVPQEQWFCTAARARASAYPGKLDLCAKALAIPQKKDLAGGKLMKKLSTEGTGTEEEYERVLEYCMQDVVVEATIGMVVRDLTREEWKDYHVCERMNDRGIPIDADLARAAQSYAEVEAAEIAKELNAATGGAITSAKQFARIKQWVAVKAPEIAEQFTDEETGKFSLDRSARTAIFESDLNLSEEVREVLELIDDAGRASTAKYAAIENRTDTDGRLRGAYLFNGAGQTGRYSAMGFQPHNLVRDKLDNSGDVIEAVLDGASADEVTTLSGQNMLTTLARMLRPTIVAENGNVLVWADYSAVEARALPWLSGTQDAEPLLDLFRKNEDVYKHAASGIYGVRADAVDKAQRQIGKISTLALGYGGGANAFRKMARAYGLKITDTVAEEIKVAWRLANPWAKTFWRDLETAAILAVRHPGDVAEAGRIKYLMHGDMLYALLPCGRLIAYPEVELVEIEGKYGPQPRLTALKASMHPKKGETAWPRVALYGGLLAENCLAGDTEVLTPDGWVELADVGARPVWDGVEFVRHDGVIAKGIRLTGRLDGVRLTSDHKVLTAKGWVDASEAEGFDRASVRALDGYSAGGQRAGVWARELPLGYASGAGAEYPTLPVHRHTMGAHDGGGRSGTVGHRGDDIAVPFGAWEPAVHEAVYDILNCGPRQRFVVRGHSGPFIVHNCTQAFCASLLRTAVRHLDDAGWPVVMHTHDEVLVEVGEDEIEEAKAALQEAMLTNPWPDLPLAAEPEYGYSYDK